MSDIELSDEYNEEIKTKKIPIEKKKKVGRPHRKDTIYLEDGTRLYPRIDVDKNTIKDMKTKIDNLEKHILEMKTIKQEEPKKIKEPKIVVDEEEPEIIVVKKPKKKIVVEETETDSSPEIVKKKVKKVKKPVKVVKAKVVKKKRYEPDTSETDDTTDTSTTEEEYEPKFYQRNTNYKKPLMNIF